MAQLWMHEPTDENIVMLNSQISAVIPDSVSPPIIVRQHYIYRALNMQKLKETAAINSTLIMHCKAKVISNHSVSMH